MPLNQETIPNKPLNGIEIRDLMMRDLEKMLANDCMVSDNLAYGRISWKLRYSLNFDNPVLQNSEISYATRPHAHNDPNKIDQLEAFPLEKPSTEAVFSSSEAERNVESPNAERLRAGIPVEVQTIDDEGKRVGKLVQYENSPDNPDTLSIRDVTDEERAEQKITLPPPRPESDEPPKFVISDEQVAAELRSMGIEPPALPGTEVVETESITEEEILAHEEAIEDEPEPDAEPDTPEPDDEPEETTLPPAPEPKRKVKKHKGRKPNAA